jgi:hypothetical protein
VGLYKLNPVYLQLEAFKCNLYRYSEVSASDLRLLYHYVRHVRDPAKPFGQGPFDLWWCVHCDEVIDSGVHCVDCKSVSCECKCW